MTTVVSAAAITTRTHGYQFSCSPHLRLDARWINWYTGWTLNKGQYIKSYVLGDRRGRGSSPVWQAESASDVTRSYTNIRLTAMGWHCFLPCPRLPSQLQSVTAWSPWPVPLSAVRWRHCKSIFTGCWSRSCNVDWLMCGMYFVAITGPPDAQHGIVLM